MKNIFIPKKERQKLKACFLVVLLFLTYQGKTQSNNVSDNAAPVFTSGFADKDFCLNARAQVNCFADVTLTVTATDNNTPASEINYTYWIDKYNDGTVEFGGNGKTYTSSKDPDRFIPEGTHHIKWTAEDGSGNIAVLESLFTVSDCTGPRVNALNGLGIDLKKQEQADVWATELNNGSFDNCSDVQEFKIAVPSGGMGQLAPPQESEEHYVFTCADLTKYGSIVCVDLWAKDWAGNWSYTSTYVLLEDLDNTCNNAVGIAEAASKKEITEIKNNIDLKLVTIDSDQKTENEVITNNPFKLYQNTPNPFKNETVIGFDLGEASTVSLKVYDLTGKVLTSIEKEFTKGYNEINLNRSDLSATGVLYYTLKTTTDASTKKMILVE